MDKSIESYEKAVKSALEVAGRYTPALDLQIRTLASALRTVDLANSEIDGLDSTTVATPHGLKAHPVFRIKKEAEDSASRQLKSLGLTAEMLQDDVENDPLVELTEKLQQAGQKPKVIKPRKRK